MKYKIDHFLVMVNIAEKVKSGDQSIIGAWIIPCRKTDSSGVSWLHKTEDYLQLSFQVPGLAGKICTASTDSDITNLWEKIRDSLNSSISLLKRLYGNDREKYINSQGLPISGRLWDQNKRTIEQLEKVIDRIKIDKFKKMPAEESGQYILPI